MGLLVDGQWHDQWYDNGASGRFERKASSFRNWVTPDGAAGPSGTGGFAAEPGRYHLYVSLACPWAHRALIMRALKGLETTIPISVVNWRMGERGWTFAPGPGVVPDPINGAEVLYQVYQAADPAYTGRVTVPVLWDKARARSSATNRPRSSACSTRLSPVSGRRLEAITPSPCGPKSTP